MLDKRTPRQGLPAGGSLSISPRLRLLKPDRRTGGHPSYRKGILITMATLRSGGRWAEVSGIGERRRSIYERTGALQSGLTTVPVAGWSNIPPGWYETDTMQDKRAPPQGLPIGGTLKSVERLSGRRLRYRKH